MIPKLLWPLLVYDVSMTAVEAMERKINVALRKWVGVPPCLTDVALYCKRTKLVLPFKSVVEEFKVGKARLAMMLRDSPDPKVRENQPALKTGRKWKVHDAIEKAESALKLKEVMGCTQTNRVGLGFEQGRPKWWSKASTKERRDMVIREIRTAEDELRVQKAVQQSQQGQHTSWEEVMARNLTWRDIWGMAPLRLSFLVRAGYDLLPSATNLVKWRLSNDASCPLCGARQTLEHVLSSCKKALCQGRYTWRHNEVLRALHATLCEVVQTANHRAGPVVHPFRFLKAGSMIVTNSKSKKIANDPTILDCARDWQIAVDLAGHDPYPEVIRKTRLRPDIVLHSPTARQLIMVELTVPYESRIEEQHLYKLEKYSDLAASLRKTEGYTVRLFAVEIGARGMVAHSAYDVLKQLGLRGKARTRALKQMGNAAEQASCWLWSRRDQ